MHCHNLDENGIKRVCLSHTLHMENQENEKQDFTKANEDFLTEKRVSLSAQEALEYRDYKRQRKRVEIINALAKSEGVLAKNEDAGRISERAVKLRQAAVRLTPTRLENAGEFFLRRAVAIDCVVGGTGETLTKVKIYETKLALKLRAQEISLVLSPYKMEHCRYAEIKQEIKKVLRVAKKAKVKVLLDRQYPRANLSRLARLCGELGVAYFCVPYFDGCELLRMDMSGGCKLQVSGVDNLEQYRRLIGAGVGRIVTTRAWEIYNEWMLEVEKIDFPALGNIVESPLPQGEKQEETLVLPPLFMGKEPLLPLSVRKKEEGLECACRAEGAELKFL